MLTENSAAGENGATMIGPLCFYPYVLLAVPATSSQIRAMVVCLVNEPLTGNDNPVSAILTRQAVTRDH
jgi:hypothetical protein